MYIHVVQTLYNSQKLTCNVVALCMYCTTGFTIVVVIVVVGKSRARIINQLIDNLNC